MARFERKPSTCKPQFVAAIDFGTTYSGYAFSSKSDWTKVQTNVWTGSNQMSSKTPTALLLKSDQTFLAFGYDAENQYTTLVEDGEHGDHYYFHRFKMLLHSLKNINRDVLIKDEAGKPLEAHKVFSMSIEYLKDCLMEKLKIDVPDTKLQDVHFVLTVPAIWGDAWKQFMREAAVAAGLRNEQLSIILEPEAASIYCQHLPTEVEIQGDRSFFKRAEAGTKYLVLDVGGGTNITVHRKTHDGSPNLASSVTTVPWGGTTVDDAFAKFLSSILGDEVLKRLKEDSMEDYIDLFREFESKKRGEAMKTGEVHMKIPLELQTITKKMMKKSMAQALENTEYGDSVHFANMKIHMSGETFQKMFHDTVNGIRELLKELFQKKEIKDVNIILMVGGFSECELVQREVKREFPKMRVIIPEEPGLAVLKGAVYYGHITNTKTRVARYTYGIQSWPEFDPAKHPESKKVMLEGTPRCKDVFLKYIQKGTELPPGFQRSQTFQFPALERDNDCFKCNVYISDKEDPQFVDEDGCRLLGSLTVPIPVELERFSLEIRETMIFEETGLRVQIRAIYEKQHYEVKFGQLPSGF